MNTPPHVSRLTTQLVWNRLLAIVEEQAQTLMRTAFYQKWSSVHQFPDTIDQYGAQTDAERTLGTFGIKSDITRVHGRHTVKAGLDLVLLRPREDLYYLSQPWITYTHLPTVNEPHVHLRGPNGGPGVPRPVVFNGKETGGQASAFVQDTANYVTPDVAVKKIRGRWTAILNSDVMPQLRVNEMYAQVLQKNRGSTLAGQLQEARWLIKNVHQRFDTILRVSQAVVERQKAFFQHGEVAMRPLVLREIADVLGLHESTVSRVTTAKYMSTPFGTYELKFFFGSHVATDTGGAASSTAIRALIKQLIAAEDQTKPISDSRIADLLGEKGIVVARRTVAKYREALKIPSVAQRKAA